MKKKAQEEMIGFALIMVIVAVVMMIFLGITLRKPAPTTFDSSEAYHFLESTMIHTTNCELRFAGDYATVSEVIRACSEGKNCFGGEDSCEELETLLDNVISSSYVIGNESQYSSYTWESIYRNNEVEELVITISDGNCTRGSRGATYTTPAFPGSIVTSFELCN